MSVPCDIIVKFDSSLPDTVQPDAVITSELQTRMQRLLTGQYKVDAQGRCVIDIVNPWNGDMQARDSVCVGVDLGPISISYCKDV